MPRFAADPKLIQDRSNLGFRGFRRARGVREASLASGFRGVNEAGRHDPSTPTAVLARLINGAG